MENQIFSQPVDQEHKPFEIDCDSMAEWAMRKIAEARNDTLKWQQHFADQLESIRKANEETEAFFTLSFVYSLPFFKYTALKVASICGVLHQDSSFTSPWQP